MSESRAPLFTPVLLGAGFIILVSFAVRNSFGLFQIPVAEEFNWPRAEFSLALALQGLAWGIGQPFFGAIAERMGDRLALALGALVYAAGLLFSAWAVTPLQHQILQTIIGFGVAGTGFGVILAVVGRAASDENRSLAMGLVTAAGSLGQVVGPPMGEFFLSRMHFSSVFLVFAAIILLCLLALPMIKPREITAKVELDESLGETLRRAMTNPSFILIFLGFFSCGYQLGFVVAHFPAMIAEMCGPIQVGSLLHSSGITTTTTLGAVALSLIGLANIGGAIAAGWLGNHYPKKYLLALVYTGRTIIASVFILIPITPLSVIVFSVLMGALWLATVPLTSGLVAHIFGLRYMGTLYGIVFFSHQLGGFMGVWLGGRFYDAYGDYTMVWWLGVAVGAFSALVHLPIREAPWRSPAVA